MSLVPPLVSRKSIETRHGHIQTQLVAVGHARGGPVGDHLTTNVGQHISHLTLGILAQRGRSVIRARRHDSYQGRSVDDPRRTGPSCWRRNLHFGVLGGKGHQDSPHIHTARRTAHCTGGHGAHVARSLANVATAPTKSNAAHRGTCPARFHM